LKDKSDFGLKAADRHKLSGVMALPRRKSALSRQADTSLKTALYVLPDPRGQPRHGPDLPGLQQGNIPGANMKNKHIRKNTGLCLISCAGALVALTATAGFTQVSGSTNAQSRNLNGPWTGSNSAPGWQFDITAGVEMERNLGSATTPLTGGLAMTSDSERSYTFGGQATYVTGNGLRYTARLTEEEAELGAWWQVNRDFTVGLTASYAGEGGPENEGRDLTAAQHAAFDTGSSVDTRLRAAWRFGDFTVNGSIGDDRGLVASAGIGWDRFVTDRLRLGARADVEYGSASANLATFGVTTAQASASGLNAYRPGSGITGTTIGLEAEYLLNDQWSLTTGLTTDLLSGTARTSPLYGGNGSVNSQNKGNYEFGIGARFSF